MVYFSNVSTIWCHITVLYTPVSARILALVLQLYERNQLKLKLSCCEAAVQLSVGCMGHITSLAQNTTMRFSFSYLQIANSKRFLESD